MSEAIEERPLYDLGAIMRDTGMVPPEGGETYPLDGELSCEQCGTAFKPRSSGGKKQRFCSPVCRQAYHSTNEGHSDQRGQRSTLGTALVPTQRASDPENNSKGRYEAFVIPSQLEIECTRLPDGGVRIRQEGEHGGEDGQQIDIADGNVVTLARYILFAAGFRGILIATVGKGGYIDLEDGDTYEGATRD